MCIKTCMIVHCTQLSVIGKCYNFHLCTDLNTNAQYFLYNMQFLLPATFLLTRNHYSHLRDVTDVHHAPLQTYAMPQSEEDASLMIQLRVYGFPPHFANTVFESFSRYLLGRQAGRWANFLATHIS
jgi:hypothetical protein